MLSGPLLLLLFMKYYTLKYRGNKIEGLDVDAQYLYYYVPYDE